MKAPQTVGFTLLAFGLSGSGCSPDDRPQPADVPELTGGVEYVGETWQLEEVLRIGQEGGVDLHRVRGAAFLSSVEIAIADAGNHRVAVFGGGGSFVRSFGREGDGPAEYRNLMLVAGFGDTIATFDNVLARITLWSTDGSLIDTHAVPTFKGEPLDIRAVISTDEYIATTRPAMDPERSTGIFTETVDVVRVRLSAFEIEKITDLEWRQMYQYAEADGGVTAVTVYQLPFLGQSRVVVQGYRAVCDSTRLRFGPRLDA